MLTIRVHVADVRSFFNRLTTSKRYVRLFMRLKQGACIFFVHLLTMSNLFLNIALVL